MPDEVRHGKCAVCFGDHDVRDRDGEQVPETWRCLRNLNERIDALARRDQRY